MRDRAENTANLTADSAIIAFTGILCSLIIFFYRIPIAGIIGTEGVSYYTFSSAIYNIMLIISSYSLPMAVSKLISSRIVSGRYTDAQNVFRTAMVYAVFFGGILFFFFQFGAPLLSRLFGDLFPSYSLRALAPCIWIMACLGVLRGYFQGIGLTRLTAASQIPEHLVSAVCAVILSVRMAEQGYKADLIYDTTSFRGAFGAAGAIYGVSIGAFAALVFLSAAYVLGKKEADPRINSERLKRRESSAHIKSALGSQALPIILCAVFFNVTIIADEFLFSALNPIAGHTGDIYAMCSVFAKFAVIFYILQLALNSTGAALIPLLSRGTALRDKKLIVSAIRRGTRGTLSAAIPGCVCMAVLSEPMCRLFFGGEDIAPLKGVTALGAVFILFFAYAAVTTGILQGMGHAGEPVMNSVTALIIHVIVLTALIFLTEAGIYGVVAANIVFAAVMALLNNMCIKRHIRMRKRTAEIFTKPLLAALSAGAVVFAALFLYSLAVPAGFYESRLGCAIPVIGGVALFAGIYASVKGIVFSI